MVRNTVKDGQSLCSVKVKKSSPKSLSADCRYTVGQLSAGSIPTVNRQLTNSKPTLKNLTSVMTSQSVK